MGRKFKLSNMIPNAWFYKLRDMAAVHSNQKTHHLSQSSSSVASSSSSFAITRLSDSKPNQPLPRKSYHFSRQLAESNGYYDFPLNAKFSDHRLPELPRKSSTQRRRKRSVSRSSPKLVKSSVSAGCSCAAALDSMWSKSGSPPEFSSSPFDSSPDVEFRTDAVLATESFHDGVSWTASKSNSCVCKTNLNDGDGDIIIDVKKNSIMTKAHKVDDFNSLPDLELAPIITKPAIKQTEKPRNKKSSVKTEELNSRRSLSLRITKEEKIIVKEQRNSPSRKIAGNSVGVRLRINSPRIASRKIYGGGSGRKSISSGSNKSLSDSLAIVKSSCDPQRDFRESMVEMIVENNIRTSKDLEDLLACYLSLNADEYHDLIIKVFKQIWFDLPNSRVK